MTTFKCKTTLRDEKSNDVLFLAGKDYELQDRRMGKFGLWGEDNDLYWFPMPIDENEDCITNHVFNLSPKENE
jgi:hypothetical protein